MAIASAPGARLRTAAVERSGHDSGGRRPGSEPTSRTPCSPPCSAAAVRLPAIIASSRPGSRGRKTLKSTAVTSVTAEIASTVGLASGRCRKMFSQMWMNACCFVPGMPRKVLIWLVPISRAAPAVKPTTTECEMKFTIAPSRARPSASWNGAGHEGQRQHHPDVIGAPGVGERGDGGEHDDGDRRRRPRDQMVRRAEERRDHRRHDGAIQPVLGGQAGDQGECHPLRQHDDRAGDPGQQVGARAAGGDQAAPAQEGEQPAPVELVAPAGGPGPRRSPT